MGKIENFKHESGIHCESNTIMKLLKNYGEDVSESMIFGVGSGPMFYFLKNIRPNGVFAFPATREPGGALVENINKLTDIRFFSKKFKTEEDAFELLHQKLDEGELVAVSVDMYYMKYLPPFLRVHTPFHFLLVIDRDKENDAYTVSDPYHTDLAVITHKELKTAWATNGLFARDNFLVYIENKPDNIDWKNAVIKSINRVCKKLILPPIIKNILSFVGPVGMRKFAKYFSDWANTMKALDLQEALFFTSAGFEEQGTGGGAYRLMYGKFLQDVSELYGWDELKEFADRILSIGQRWRKNSLEMVRLGKKIPTKDEKTYDEWYSDNKEFLHNSFKVITDEILAIADLEEAYFKDLSKVAKKLK